jgi:hypothetical protein
LADGAQAKRREDVEKQIERLGSSAGIPRNKRSGAEDWRALELEKLREIVTSCCRASEVACRDCLAPLAGLALAPDELWAIYAAFLDPLRNRATAGVEVLGAALLQHPEGRIRDRAFRIAVGSGVSSRSEPSPEGFRITTLPRAPRGGEPVLIILEHSARCTEVKGEVKGPDAAGRIDLDPQEQCPEPDEPTPTAFMPIAIRYVFTHRIEAMPDSGLDIWLAEGKAPLLRVPAAAAPRK